MGTRFYLYSLMLLCLGGYLLAEWKGISFSSFNVATDAKIRQALARVDSLQKDRVRYIQIHNQELEKRQQLQGMTAGLWLETTRIPTNIIQKELDQMARRSELDLGKLGAPREIELSSNIRAVDISVQCTTNIEAFAKFTHAIDGHTPILFWESCHIRPKDLKNPVELTVKGKIRALVLTKAAQEYLNEAVGAEAILSVGEEAEVTNPEGELP